MYEAPYLCKYVECYDLRKITDVLHATRTLEIDYDMPQWYIAMI
jgi:hypothetical protein